VVPEDDFKGFVARICRRKMSVGADGLILVENTEQADFKWRFYNSDGSVAEMCGNGARCVARFAYLNGIAGENMAFETLAGVIHAQVTEKRVKISMPDPIDLVLDEELATSKGEITISSVNTGVPHVVIESLTVEDVDVVALGREIRHHFRFAPAGTNVNFLTVGSGRSMAIRTYERGVEDETLACGTGAVAAAVVRASKLKVDSPVNVMTRSGEQLRIYFNQEEGTFSKIYLEGDARIIYQGNLWSDAWDKPLAEGRTQR
jgi:diaminopimelate epimerase